jgi:hypothetical protein
MDAVMRAHYGQGPNWITVKSGQGPGKTTVSGIIGLWRALWAEDALTVVTAPTMRQCTEIWLAEVRRQLKKADPWLQRYINITKTKIEIGGRPDWGIKLVTATREENAQGFHEENMTVIMEEASGIPIEIVTQFKGTLTNPNALLIMIGNPNTRDCAFFDSFYGVTSNLWEHLTWNAEDTARDYPEILNPQRNFNLAEEFGRDSDVYRIRVLGEFPYTDPNCVISGEDVQASFDKRLAYPASVRSRSHVFGGGLARQFGIDFARFGGDESTVYKRQGYAILDQARFVRRDPSEAVAASFRMQVDSGWSNSQCVFVCDAGGMGQGLMHSFYSAGKQVVEFHNGGVSLKPREYANRATEGWFHLARILRAREAYIPTDHVLLKQLAGRQYYTNKKGLLILETKEEYEKRGFDSPDRADGVVYAFWDHVQAVGHSARQGSSGNSRTARMTR